MSPFIVDIHQPKFTDTKGIWMIKTTKEGLYKAIQDVETLLELLPDILLNELFNLYNTFPAPRVIPSYGTLYLYTEKVTSNVATVLNNEDTTHSKSPTNAWNCGPPLMSSQQNSEQKQTSTMNIKSNNITEKAYKELKQSIKESQK
eukprot:2011180-Ditylum_brightwellii.AAC.1